jgi:hypothetical protein
MDAASAAIGRVVFQRRVAQMPSPTQQSNDFALGFIAGSLWYSLARRNTRNSASAGGAWPSKWSSIAPDRYQLDLSQQKGYSS